MQSCGDEGMVGVPSSFRVSVPSVCHDRYFPGVERQVWAGRLVAVSRVIDYCSWGVLNVAAVFFGLFDQVCCRSAAGPHDSGVFGC